jgi:DeoR family fructose operon transcriptional repressor
LTTYERRQRLLEIVRKQPGIRVPEIAQLLQVSEGTVRNDLRALAETRQLSRVRGGAILDVHHSQSPAFSARARVREDAKRCIARRAAELVADGDTILFDASTTVFHMAHFLQDRRNLTVITNGVEIARCLAQDTSNTVILLGGELRADGTSVTGPISERILQDLRAKTAFLSCTGIALNDGLYEVDFNEAHLKCKAVGLVGSVVALIDSSKFGKVDLTTFARIDQIAHIFTDSNLEQRWIEQLRQTPVLLTICGEESG